MEVDAFIPSTYIKNEMQKLDMYKRIAEIETREEQLKIGELRLPIWYGTKYVKEYEWINKQYSEKEMKMLLKQQSLQMHMNLFQCCHKDMIQCLLQMEQIYHKVKDN